MLAMLSGFFPLPLSWGLAGWCLGAAEGFGTWVHCWCDFFPIPAATQWGWQTCLGVSWQDSVGCLEELSGCHLLQNLSWGLLCWVCPGSQDNLGHCFIQRLPVGCNVSEGCLQPLLILIAGKKAGLRLTSLTSETAERKEGRKAGVSQPSYHLQLGGYRLQNGKKTIRAVKKCDPH